MSKLVFNKPKKPRTNMPEELTGDLTKREFFAVMAMQGLMSGPLGHVATLDTGALAKNSVSYADALINELVAQKPVALEDKDANP